MWVFIKITTNCNDILILTQPSIPIPVFSIFQALFCCKIAVLRDVFCIFISFLLTHLKRFTRWMKFDTSLKKHFKIMLPYHLNWLNLVIKDFMRTVLKMTWRSYSQLTFLEETSNPVTIDSLQSFLFNSLSQVAIKTPLQTFQSQELLDKVTVYWKL